MGTMLSRSYPPKVHAASLLSLQLWAFSELSDFVPPLGQAARTARLAFLGLVLVLVVSVAFSYPLAAFVRWALRGRIIIGIIVLLFHIIN